MHVSFVTSENFALLTEDDRKLAKYLRARNMVVTPAIWDDPSVDWDQFDAIVLRSMWDYFEKPIAFNLWLDELEKKNAKVINPLTVVKWNQDKNYFDRFASKGVTLPSYSIQKKGSAKSLQTIMNEHSWSKAVVKPAISGGAYNTWVIHKEVKKESELSFTELLATRDMIVQQFIEEVVTAGELSLIFFDKKFSHAIVKNPKRGDFRVQTQFGGTSLPFTPNLTLVENCRNLLNHIPERLLYARVDGVVVNSDFLLMELELIEPNLTVANSENGCEMFYETLKSWRFI